MMEGLALGIGGALLLTPGFITDAMGFACLFPPTRKLLVNAMSKRLSVGVATGGFPPGGFTQGSSGPRSGSKPVTGDVIEGEYTRKD